MNLTSPKIIQEILEKHGLAAKKFLGQNFLIDQNVLQKIVEAAEIDKDDKVIEVGPGLGVLTAELGKNSKTVTSIEIDKNLLPVLKETLADFDNIEIIHQDALTFTPPKETYKLVANIPYYITSPLITHFLHNENPPKSLTLLTQKEVAEKICQLDPKMSVLSLQIALFGRAEFIKKVPASCFLPSPKVDSAILNIKTHENSVPNAEKILKTAKKAFSQKRKKLSNTLPELKEKLNLLNLADKRPETLSIKDWQALLS